MMPEAETRSQRLLARLAIVIAAVLIALALFWYGFAADVQKRLWQDIFDRPGGPMSFRFVLQPVMAAIAAYHDGARDARAGLQPFLTRLVSGGGERAGLMNEALVSTARIILLGFAMDGIYQATVLKTFYPGEMVVIAIALAFVPYLLLRGPFSRLAAWWAARKNSGSQA